jgi:hypothetical protein
MDNTQDNTPKQDTPNGPVDRINDGPLKVSIWKNSSEKGKDFYTAELTRTYKDAEGNLRNAHSFARDDLLKVSELARKAYDRTAELRREDFQKSRSAKSPTQSRSDRER